MSRVDTSRGPSDPAFGTLARTPIHRGPTMNASRLATLLMATIVAAPAQSWSDSAPLAAESEIRMASGSTFSAPAGWFLSDKGGVRLLQDPERLLRVAFVESDDSTGAQAIAKAWSRVDPGFARTIRQTVTPPARDGWDEVMQSVYETTAQEARVVVGVARRKGATWHVNLIDGPASAMEKRAAQVNTAILGWKPPGLEEESFAGRKARVLDAERLALLERFIEEARVQTKVPGAALAIVQDGKVVYQKGFGVRRQGGAEPVTPGTRFMIGSITKPLTTLMMAKLVDEKRFDWDTPVVKLHPGFALADAAVTPQVTMAHTVCACTGLPRQDMEFLFEFAGATPESRVASMKTMKPTTGFGETFQYSNPMVSTGGYVAALAAEGKGPMGPAYDRVMQSRVFDPLGMKATTFDPQVATRGDHAIPHGRNLRAEFTPIRVEDEAGVISVRPAGALWSTVEDMSRYVLTELARGVAPDGKRLVSEASLLERRKPRARMSDQASYGLGLMVETDHGVTVVHHGGNNLGFTADLFFLPEHGVGAVMLTNGQGANLLTGVVQRRLLEILFDGREEASKTLAFAVQQQQESIAKLLEEVRFEPEPAWIAKLAGSYSNPDLGTLVVRADAGGATVDAGEWTCAVGERKDTDGSRLLILTGAPLAGLPFLPGEQDGAPTLTLKTAQQQYVFTRTPAEAAAK
jgi:CubicO group peptidase (beta-lactamase class C family)